jgi:hypothetical protein
MRNTILVLLALLALSSCKSTTEPTDDGPVVWTMPLEGSQYRMDIVTTDSATTVETTTDKDIYKILESNVSWMGRDSVFLYGWGATFATYHVTFEPDGNTGYESGNEIDIYPTGQKGRITQPTKTEDQGSNALVTTSYKENQGREKITLAGKTWNAIRIFGKTVTVSASKTDGSVLYSQTTAQTWWFVPELGFCAKTVRDLVMESGGNRSLNRRSQTLSEIL